MLMPKNGKVKFSLTVKPFYDEITHGKYFARQKICVKTKKTIPFKLCASFQIFGRRVGLVHIYKIHT